MVLSIDECSDICEGLVSIQVLEVSSGPVGERLGGAIVSVLEGVEHCPEIRCYLHGEPSVCGRVASALSADVQEHHTLGLVELGIIHKVPLVEGGGIIGGSEMIECLGEGLLLEISKNGGVQRSGVLAV